VNFFSIGGHLISLLFGDFSERGIPRHIRCPESGKLGYRHSMRYFRSQGIGHGITSRIIEKDFSPFKKRPPRGCAIRGA
jgi:hypothetical protein